MSELYLDRLKTCCFSGHRPEKLRESFGGDQVADGLRPLLEIMIEQAIDDGYDTFLCGMARGVDLWAAELVLERKKTTHPHLRLIGAIPWRGQADRWPESDKRLYERLLKQLDGQYLVGETYTRGCPNIRNRWMVDHSTRLIAVFGGTSGGTKNTIDYAHKCGLETVVLTLSGQRIEQTRPAEQLLFE